MTTSANAFALALTLIVVALPSATAQRPLGEVVIDSGKLVRITPAVGRPVVGKLILPVSPATDIVRYCRYPGSPCAGPLELEHITTLTKAMITRIQVKRGSSALLGVGMGILFGVGLGVSTWLPCQKPRPCHRSVAAPIAAGLGLGSVGWFFGEATPRWRDP